MWKYLTKTYINYTQNCIDEHLYLGGYTYYWPNSVSTKFLSMISTWSFAFTFSLLAAEKRMEKRTNFLGSWKRRKSIRKLLLRTLSTSVERSKFWRPPFTLSLDSTSDFNFKSALRRERNFAIDFFFFIASIYIGVRLREHIKCRESFT